VYLRQLDRRRTKLSLGTGNIPSLSSRSPVTWTGIKPPDKLPKALPSDEPEDTRVHFGSWLNGNMLWPQYGGQRLGNGHLSAILQGREHTNGRHFSSNGEAVFGPCDAIGALRRWKDGAVGVVISC
jgi:hypothetical protein